MPRPVESASTTGGLPVAPSLGPGLANLRIPRERAGIDARVVGLTVLAAGVGVAAAGIAQLLGALIALSTQLAFYGRFSLHAVPLVESQRGPFTLLVPVIGGLIVGVMARYGSKAIRGHGIPEAMEQVLLNQSRIPMRMMFLKPLSAAVAIGTGGPFGAEGPIIATGGALGSVFGQWLHVTADERKTLLAAGAAAGMAATFGAPASAVLLAVELLLFELRPRSLVPVALAASVATTVRYLWVGEAPVFALPALQPPSGQAMAAYCAIGAAAGLASVGVTRLVYGIEDAFEHVPLHWMWWPALGGLVVGVVGMVAPRTLGVGYINIEQALTGELAGTALLWLCLFKLISWSVALGSGTSGGTLAPIFTLGGGLGSLLAMGMAAVLPHAGIDPRIGALVGMAALFAGASRALLASVVFAFETTRQPLGLLPLLMGCSLSFLVSSLLMRNTLMTEKIARRGVRVPSDYEADYLERVLVREAARAPVVKLRGGEPVASVRVWLTSGAPGSTHVGFPVIGADQALCGVLLRRELLEATVTPETTVASLLKRAPVVCFEDQSLRQAADHMVDERVGRLPVVRREDPTLVVAMLTRKDLIAAHARRLADTRLKRAANAE